MFTTIIIVIALLYFLRKLQPVKGLKTISVTQLKLMLHEEDKVFIDVRTPEEFRVKNIPQFRNLPLGSNFSNLPKDQEIIVICQSGIRSKQACVKLKKQGYTNVTNLRGGMRAY